MPTEEITPTGVNGLKQIMERIAQKAVNEFARSSFLNAASISGPGGLTIQRGGFLKLVTAANQTVALIGGLRAAFNLADGSAQPGTVLYRADGSTALAVFDPDPVGSPYQQFIAIYDRFGNQIIADDTDSGVGLSRPYLSIPFQPSPFTEWMPTMAATMTTLWEATVPKQHPKLQMAVVSTSDMMDTAGDWQLVANGAVVATGAVGFAQVRASVGPVAIPGSHLSTVQLRLQARRTAGLGNVRVSAMDAVWRQT